jgi:hypothetical protein
MLGLGIVVEVTEGRYLAPMPHGGGSRPQPSHRYLPVGAPGTRRELPPEREHNRHNGASLDSRVWNAFLSTAVGEPLKPLPHVSVTLDAHPLAAPLRHALESEPAVHAVPQSLLESTLRNVELRRTLQPLGNLNPHAEERQCYNTTHHNKQGKPVCSIKLKVG